MNRVGDRLALVTLVALTALAAGSPREAVAQTAPPSAVTPTTAKQTATNENAPRGNVPLPGKVKAGSLHLSLRASVLGRASGERFSAFPVDTTGAKTPETVDAGSRLTWKVDLDLRLDSWKTLLLEYHFAGDFLTGTYLGGPGDLQGDRLPGSTFDNHRWTATWMGVRAGKSWGVRIGQMMSQWGLGLLANDGMNQWDSRADGWFELPNTGDTVNRFLVWARPWAGTGSALRGLVFSVAADQVVNDDIQVRPATRSGNLFSAHDVEPAVQGVLAARMYLAERRWIGMYLVKRNQRLDDSAYFSTAGKYIDANVIDFALDFDERKAGTGLRVQAEAVALLGTTTAGPTPEFPTHDIEQLAIAARVRYDQKAVRFEADIGYFSGDANTDDGAIRNFKADPNHQVGLVLYPRLLAWQSGRAGLTASNDQIVGVPPEDIERFASGGSVTNALHIFGKAGARVSRHLELYGGVLLAVAPSPPVDPFHTKTAGGGQPRNFLGGVPDGALLGTEIDAGFRFRWPFGDSGRAFTVRVEYGVLSPGGALQGPNGDELGLIHGGRAVVALGGDPFPSTPRK